MRHQWRVLHLHLLRAHKTIPNHFHPHLLPSFSSIPSHFTTNNNNSTFPINPNFRTFTSQSILTHADSNLTIIANVFSKSRDLDDINKLLESNNFSINHDTLNSVLWKLDSDPVTAQRFFQWISQNHPEKLSSKSYNAMLRVLGANGIVDEFWDLVGFMKKRGYGVSRGVRKRVLECFQNKGMDGDVVKLKDLFNKNTFRDLCRIVRDNVWSDDVEKQIRDLNLGFSSELVKLVLENLDTEPNKGLIFFRWVEESGMFKHDGCTYNAMARVLGREDSDSDSIHRFWKLVGDMRNAGFEMESETFVKILRKFCEREMIEDAVKLYHFAMEGANKPSLACCNFLLRKVVSYKKFCKKKMIKDAVELYQFAVEGGSKPSCCKFLLRKIVAAKHEELDMELFSRVMKVYTGNGNAVTDSMATAILRSATGNGNAVKEKDWNNIMKEMLDCGLVPSLKLQCEIVEKFCKRWYMEKTDNFVNRIEASGCSLDHMTFHALVEGLIFCGYYTALDESNPNIVFASKILYQLVKEKELKPRHCTYKLLITKLLEEKEGFVDALNILGLMRNHGFPPFTDPFIESVSQSGSGDDAVQFLKVMTSKRFPFTSVYLRMLEAFLMKGRHEEAHKFLSKSPSYVRNDADVLNMLAN